ncbi:MAG: glutathione S-transferase family protein [Sphingomonas sp.]|uniref:glutathione S-transferase family protein n=1 Tax=Sphingomonas sp. TaxID=28214 RepID=UPI001B101C43|nr:glutathione S-transferase family protein [Sphingomonas sp.]MBO9622882.1 glutathione S-transferase family protein [Sphingomonas sp.]
MKPILYAHPFSSYCQKVLVALYENGVDFDYRMVSPDNPSAGEELYAHWPIGKFPLLVDDGRAVLESSTIIEYLQNRHAGPVRLIPDEPDAAVKVRMMDRVFDNYVMTPMQKLVGDALRPEESRDPYGCEQARATLDTIYAWLDQRLAPDGWATGVDFTLADCAAAPSLFYADWAHPIAEQHARLRGYRARLLARPSFARAVNEARPYRPFFPLGAPDRD